jgi:WD40 repeat protein
VTLEPLQTIAVQSSGLRDVAFAPDGRRVATLGGEQVFLWETARGTNVRTWRVPGRHFTVVAFRPDGRQLAAGTTEATIHLWNTETGRAEGLLTGSNTWVSGLAYHADGRRLISTTYRRLCVWDVAARGLLAAGALRADSNIYRPSLDPAGGVAATASHDHRIVVWDLGGPKELRELQGHEGAVQDVCFRPDGRELASASLDGTARVWTWPEGVQRLCLPSRLRVNGVAWIGGGRRLLTAERSADDRQGGVCLWSTVTGRQLGEARLGAGQFQVACQPDGSLFATAGEDGALRLWRLPR